MFDFYLDSSAPTGDIRQLSYFWRKMECDDFSLIQQGTSRKNVFAGNNLTPLWQSFEYNLGANEASTRAFQKGTFNNLLKMAVSPS